MQKKIDSMEDYLGIAKKKFEQMKKDAEFYKDKQEELSLAQRKLKSGGELFTNYITEILYKEKKYKVNPSASPSAFLTGVTDYKSDTLKNNENYEKEREELGEEFRESSMNFSNAVRTQTSEVKNDRDVKALSTTQCLEVLEKGEKFCRKYKQEIKDIFEEEMKKFSKEKTKLAELSKLTNQLETAGTLTEKIKVWNNIKEHYKKIKNDSTSVDDPVNQVYKAAKEIISQAFIDLTNKFNTEKTCLGKITLWNNIKDCYEKIKDDFTSADDQVTQAYKSAKKIIIQTFIDLTNEFNTEKTTTKGKITWEEIDDFYKKIKDDLTGADGQVTQAYEAAKTKFDKT